MRLIAVALVLLQMLVAARAGEVTVAVASNFAVPMRDIATAFEAKTNHRVTVVTGATGALYAQIVNGAPFEVFMAADAERPAALVRSGLVESGDRATYAIGTLVLWTRDAAHPVEGQSTLRALGASDRIAIANPKLAPYGRAALQAMDAMGVRAALESQLVMGQNVAQGYQYAVTGNARFAFVAASLVYRDGVLRSGAGWRVPAALHEPVRQDAVLLRRARDNAAARALFDYLTSAEAQTVLRRYGYEAG